MIIPKPTSILALATWCVALSCGLLNAQLPATLKLEDNKSLNGDIVSWTPTLITIKEKGLEETVTIETKKITKIDFNHEAKAKPNKKNQDNLISSVKIKYRFNTTEHETLVGYFTSIDDNYITLKTLYAGEIKIKRKFIYSMIIKPFSESLYNGPNKLEEWNNTLNAWEFKNNALICGKEIANIAKDVKLPDLAHIQFEHQWKKRLALSFFFYSNSDNRSNPTRYYELVFQYGVLAVKKFNNGRATILRPNDTRNKERFKLGRDLKKKSTAKYDIFLDKKEGLIHIIVNGKHINTFTDKKPEPENYGTGIHFANQKNTPMRISNIKISKWTGHLHNFEGVKDDEPKILKQVGGTITLKNGDKIIGKISKIKNGIMAIDTSATQIRVPVRSMRLLDLSYTKANEPFSYAEDVKLWLSASEFIIVKFISLNGTKLKGYHQALGEVEFNLSHIKMISYSSYDTETSNPANW